MEIEARMKVINEGNLLAVGDITLDHMFTFRQVKAVISKFKNPDGNQSWFVSMPRISIKKANGTSEWRDIVTVESGLQEEIKIAVWNSIKESLHQEIELPDCINIEVIPKPHSKTVVKGEAIVSLPEFKLSGIKIIEGKNMFVSFPQQELSVPGKEGKKEYQDLVEIPPGLKNVIITQILKKYKELSVNPPTIKTGKEKSR